MIQATTTETWPMARVPVSIAGPLETGFALSAAGSSALLTLAPKKPEIGPAYAVWRGIGAAGAVICAIVFLNESVSPDKLLSVALIVTGVIGLNLTSSPH